MDTTRSASGWQQIATLNYDISTVWETKPRTTPQNTSGPSMGQEQAMGPKTLQVI